MWSGSAWNIGILMENVCWLPHPLWCHWCTEIRPGYPKCSGLAGKSPSLLEERDSMAEFGTLQGEQALNSSPQAPKGGKREVLHHPPAQQQLLISHPLLCNWFSWNLPRMEMAGYSFDFAFLPSHVQVGNAEMFSWLSHLGRALGLWAVKCWEILCKSELVCINLD